MKSLLLLAILAASALPSVAAVVTVSGSARQPVRLVCPRRARLREMAENIGRFLTERGYAVKPGIAGIVSESYRGPQWVLATNDTYSALDVGITPPAFSAKARDEAYVLDVQSNTSGPVVVLTGKTEAGLRCAVARLVCKLANHGDRLAMNAGREVNDPLTKIRAVIMGDAARRQCPDGSPFKDADFETWSAGRIKAYPDLFQQFGFNCVQIAENRGYGSISGADLKRVQNALVTLARSARERHMLVSLDAWGDCLFVEGEAYCWNDPAQHKAMVEYIEDMGRRYGPYVDHYNIHIGDPGGCRRNGCDPSYETSQQITAEYLRVFRKYNPKVLGAMSTWCNSAFWLHSPKPVDLSNYREYFRVKEPKFNAPLPDGARFLDEKFMPREIGVAMHQSYDDDQATALAKAGRPADVWAWYIGDMEMKNNLYIAMQRVDEAYSRVPDSARDKLRLNSVEICFHGWPQIINQYCAAQKMWNPRRSIEEIEREFCVAGFGPSNADAVLELYRACENGVLSDIPQPADFGTAGYNQKLSAVLERSKTIKIADWWKPNFAFPVPAQKLVDMLIARLRLTLAVSEAKCRVETAKTSGASAEHIDAIKREAIVSLPDLPIDPIYRQDDSVVNPGFKARTYREMIAAL